MIGGGLTHPANHLMDVAGISTPYDAEEGTMRCLPISEWRVDSFRVRSGRL